MWVLLVFAVLLNSGLEHILVRANCKVTFYIRFQPNTIFWHEEANESTQLHYVMICLFRKWVSELFMLNLMISLSQGRWEENLVISPFFRSHRKWDSFGFLFIVIETSVCSISCWDNCLNRIASWNYSTQFKQPIVWLPHLVYLWWPS